MADGDSFSPEALEEAYGVVDVDAKGLISKADMAIAIRGIGMVVSDLKLSERMADVGAEEPISYGEFQRVVSGLKSDITEAELKEAMSLFDPISKGSMTGFDFRKILELYSQKMSPDEIHEFVTAAGTSDSSTVDINKFAARLMGE